MPASASARRTGPLLALEALAAPRPAITAAVPLPPAEARPPQQQRLPVARTFEMRTAAERWTVDQQALDQQTPDQDPVERPVLDRRAMDRRHEPAPAVRPAAAMRTERDVPLTHHVGVSRESLLLALGAGAGLAAVLSVVAVLPI